nr:unnamed protein product [Callosobruchus analis]
MTVVRDQNVVALEQRSRRNSWRY